MANETHVSSLESEEITNLKKTMLQPSEEYKARYDDPNSAEKKTTFEKNHDTKRTTVDATLTTQKSTTDGKIANLTAADTAIATSWSNYKNAMTSMASSAEALQGNTKKFQDNLATAQSKLNDLKDTKAHIINYDANGNVIGEDDLSPQDAIALQEQYMKSVNDQQSKFNSESLTGLLNKLKSQHDTLGGTTGLTKSMENIKDKLDAQHKTLSGDTTTGDTGLTGAMTAINTAATSMNTSSNL